MSRSSISVLVGLQKNAPKADFGCSTGISPADRSGTWLASISHSRSNEKIGAYTEKISWAKNIEKDWKRGEKNRQALPENIGQSVRQVAKAVRQVWQD